MYVGGGLWVYLVARADTHTRAPARVHMTRARKLKRTHARTKQACPTATYDGRTAFPSCRLDPYRKIVEHEIRQRNKLKEQAA